MSNTTTNTTIEILARCATLGDAVAAANIDLSYNEAEAKRSIRHIERSGGGEAYVTTDGVYYIYKADITLLNKYEPFHSMIDDLPFAMVTIEGNEIKFSDRILPKVKAMRKLIAQYGMIVG